MDKFHDDHKRMTAAVDRVTQSFTCSNGNHRARGEFVIVNRRKLCATCASARRNGHAEAMKIKSAKPKVRSAA
jgi:hypothetical protein